MKLHYNCNYCRYCHTHESLAVSSMQLQRSLLGLLLVAVAAWHHSLSELPSPYAGPAIIWTDVLKLGVGGRAFPNNTGALTFARWPAEAEADLSADEWKWGLASAGLFAQFSSNATAIHVNYTLRDANLTIYANFSPIGYSGCDLYAWDGSGIGRWRWVASVFNGLDGNRDGIVLQSPLWANASGWPTPPAPAAASQPWTTRYRLHFPSYNGVLSMAVGVPTGASLEPDNSWSTGRAAIYLGTSITQGGVTARPGSAYVSRLSRSLPAPVINLGLCGACRLEPGLAKWVGAAEPPSTLVVDCTANMSPAEVATNTPRFVRALRAIGGGWAVVPIVLIEPLTYSPAWLVGDVLNRTGLRAELKAAYATLIAEGDTALSYVTTAALEALTEPLEEMTFEGVHPMDRGHALIADALKPILDDSMRRGGRDVAAAEVAVARVGWKSAALNAWLPSAVAKSGAPTLSAAPAPPPQDAVWTDAAALTFSGRAFNTTPTVYNRLPAAAHGVVRDAVWSLSLNSAGIMVGFATDSPWLAMNLTLVSPASTMPHFSASGTSGLDVYAYDASLQRYRYVAPLIPYFETRSVAALVTPPGITVARPGQPVRWMVNLATYNSVEHLAVGVAPGFTVIPDDPFVSDRHGEPATHSKRRSGGVAREAPIVWYGTSILQGGVATRAGEIHSSRVARALGREVFNFGFSGNGKMELSVLSFLATIPSPAAFIVDCR